MAKKAPDRRIQRTRKLLQDALISMVVEKGYDATTVQDIVDRANVGRATFYAHFADKETLFHSRLEDLRSFIGEQQRHAPARLGFSRVMLEHARSNLPVWRAIAGRESGAFALQRIQRLIADLAEIDLKARGFKGTAEQRELAVQYIAGAFMAVLTWWLDRGAKLEPVDVDAVFRRLVLQGLEGGVTATREPLEMEISEAEQPMKDGAGVVAHAAGRSAQPRESHRGARPSPR
jgi:AcrR family transcriptional regulator